MQGEYLKTDFMVLSEYLYRITVQNYCLITDFSFLNMVANLLVICRAVIFVTNNWCFTWLLFAADIIVGHKNGFIMGNFREQFSWLVVDWFSIFYSVISLFVSDDRYTWTGVVVRELVEIYPVGCTDKCVFLGCINYDFSNTML